MLRKEADGSEPTLRRVQWADVDEYDDVPIELFFGPYATSGPILCDHCDKEFNSRNRLHEHMQSTRHLP